MELQRIWTLRGPSVWSRSTVFEAELRLGSAEAAPGEVSRCWQQVTGWLPALGQQTGETKTLAHLFQETALTLQRQAGSSVSFGLVHPGGEPGFYRVIVEYEEEALGSACLEAALAICLAALAGQPYDMDARLEALRDLAHDVRLGPSTWAIVQAAQKRGIPYRRLNDGSLIQLGLAARQRRICTAETDRTGAIAESIAQDKQLTRSLLQAVGVPVPHGRPVRDAGDAWEAAEEVGVPVVVKPQYGNHGRGVATNLTTREQVEQAYQAACEEGSHILVETYAPGADYRLLVIGDQLVAASLREPAHVVGDGRSTITQLVAQVNRDPRRSDGHATCLSFIKLDTVGLAVLREQGYTPELIPPAGERVLIRRNGNLSTGGTATDVTDLVHPEVVQMALDAARVIGLDIAGVDVIATDISQPLGPQGGAVVEVNAGPGLRMHLEPSAGTPRPVGEVIISSLFPEGNNGKIPTVAVTGVNGKTTTTRLTAHLLRGMGWTVGMTCTDGTYINDRRIETRDCSGPRSARAVMLNPRVEAAVLETARGGILREGLGFDCCDVAIVTNIGQGDHLGLRGVETIEELARVKQVVVEAVSPQGAAVLNAGDPLVTAMARHCQGEVIYFHIDPGHPVLAEHLGAGGRALFVRAGAIVLARGSQEMILLPVDQAPLTHQGKVAFQIENVLASVAAAWVLGASLEVIRRQLPQFRGDATQAPGRFNVIHKGEAAVIVDYAHNPSALAALVDALDAFPHRRRTLVLTACNRRDDDVIAMGEIVGHGFDRVILYGDRDNRERVDGELNALLRQGFDRASRVREVIETDSEQDAIRVCLESLAPGDLAVLGVEAIEEALAFAQDLLTRPDGSGEDAGPLRLSRA